MFPWFVKIIWNSGYLIDNQLNKIFPNTRLPVLNKFTIQLSFLINSY